MTYAYDTQFDPPAPVLTVLLTGVVRRRPQIRLPALIDTGADITAVPDTAFDICASTPWAAWRWKGLRRRPK